ncbi:unnamed protein product, partial [Mesorhabditis spiculigera]
MSGSTQDIQPFCVAAQQLDFTTWYIWQDAVKAVLNLIVPIGICYMFARRLFWVHNVFHSCCKFSMSSTLLLLLIERGLSLHPKASEKFCRFVTHGFIFLELCVFMYITLEYYALDENIVVFVLHCQEETMVSDLPI